MEFQVLLEFVKPFLGDIIGLIIVTIGLEWFVKLMIDKAKDEISLELDITNDLIKEKWTSIINVNVAKGNHILGYMERIIFYFSLLSGKEMVIVGWLAFKVAAKWQVWQHVIIIPTKLDGLSDIENIEFFKVRHTWGSKLLVVFFVGTLSNILTSFVGVIIANLITSIYS